MSDDNKKSWHVGESVKLIPYHNDDRQTTIHTVRHDSVVLAEQRGGYYVWNKADIEVIVESTTNMNYCINCKHHKINPGTSSFYRGELDVNCHNPKLGLSPVDGRPYSTLAISTRKDETQCGQDGKWFEPKETTSQRIPSAGEAEASGQTVLPVRQDTC